MDETISWMVIQKIRIAIRTTVQPIRMPSAPRIKLGMKLDGWQLVCCTVINELDFASVSNSVYLPILAAILIATFTDGSNMIRLKASSNANCDVSYPEVFIASPPPDLDCDDITNKGFKLYHLIHTDLTVKVTA